MPEIYLPAGENGLSHAEGRARYKHNVSRKYNLSLKKICVEPTSNALKRKGEKSLRFKNYLIGP